MSENVMMRFDWRAHGVASAVMDSVR